MSALYLCLLVVVGAANVYSKKVPCELTDEPCLTASAKVLLKQVVGGMPDIGLESSDPIHVDTIDAAHLPDVKYSLSDAYFYGMKDCDVEKLNFDLKAKTSLLYLVCPRLTTETNYYVNGVLESLDIQGKGKCKVVHENYHIGLLSTVEITKDAEGKPHLKIKSFEMKPLEVRGGNVYQFENLFDGDKAKSDHVHEVVNKNWKKMSVATQGPAMKAFMGVLVKNLNVYMDAVSASDMFTREE